MSKQGCWAHEETARARPDLCFAGRRLPYARSRLGDTEYRALAEASPPPPALLASWCTATCASSSPAAAEVAAASSAITVTGALTLPNVRAASSMSSSGSCAPLPSVCATGSEILRRRSAAAEGSQAKDCPINLSSSMMTGTCSSASLTRRRVSRASQTLEGDESAAGWFKNRGKRKVHVRRWSAKAGRPPRRQPAGLPDDELFPHASTSGLDLTMMLPKRSEVR